jgi:hypothetical protein
VKHNSIFLELSTRLKWSALRPGPFISGGKRAAGNGSKADLENTEGKKIYVLPPPTEKRTRPLSRPAQPVVLRTQLSRFTVFFFTDHFKKGKESEA